MPRSITQTEGAALPPISLSNESCLWFNLLNLDAPSVAVAWQLLFAKCAHVPIQPLAVVALGLAVWLIYAADRLLDVFKQDSFPPTSRHRFHRDHMAAITGCAILVLLVLVAIATLIRPVLLRDGLALTAVVALYFALIHLVPRTIQRAFPKELAVGIVFASGTCLAPWTRLSHPQALLVPAALFAALCCLNCSAIEVWEWKRFGASSASRPHSLTLWLASQISPIACAIGIAAAFLFFNSGANLLFAAIAISSVAFIWLQKEQDRLSSNVLRVLADVPLLSPLLLIGLR